MYLRLATVKKKTGVFQYVQLAHNEWDSKAGYSKTRVLYNFGRADQLDVEALQRLVTSISRFLPEQRAKAVQGSLAELEPQFEFLGSRELGGCAILDGLWRRLGIKSTLESLLQQGDFKNPVERHIFAMVANRALNPSSKMAMEHWVANKVRIDGLKEVEVHQLYRAMDFLLAAEEKIQKDVFFSVANLFNLEVDLLFLDTTTTYFEIEGEDPDVVDDSGELVEEGLRKRSINSKDSRPDKAQVSIAFAVTREGIPVRCWVWPGNTSDQSIVEQVKKDLNGWKLGRLITVMDTGFNSEKNRRILQGAGGHFIVGEKMRVGKNPLPVEALTRGGKYHPMGDGLEAKEVIVGGDSEARRRFIVVRNLKEARRDAAKRDDIVQEVKRRLAAIRQMKGEPHKKAACELRAHSTFGKYVTQDENGSLYLNRKRIAVEKRLDGKYLLSTSDDWMSTEDVVLGYKQLWAVERVFRDLKHVVDIRPFYHRIADRLRAHTLLCWMALLLIRVAENETKQTWRHMKETLDTLVVGIHKTDAGEVWRSNPLTAEQKALFSKLQLKPPAEYITLPEPRKTSN